jgi:hypothetical protein
MPDEAATGSAPNLIDRTALRRHAMAAAANFAAQAQVEIDDGELALIAEFMIAVTLTNFHNSKSIVPLPRAVLAAARLIFRLDELRLARAEVRGERNVRPASDDEQDADERADETVARFFAEVESVTTMEREDQTLKPLHDYRIWLGKVDYATAMGRLIAAWRKRRRRGREVDKALKGIDQPPRPK